MQIPAQPNMLEPSFSTMLSSLLIAGTLVGAAFYAFNRLTGALRARARGNDSAAEAPTVAALQVQVDQLSSQLAKLDQAQRFTEQLVAGRGSAQRRDGATSEGVP